ncbi:hypothetical protein F4813DRAFT_375897 [Daldinia decipiens]|uniref:uncharacterized protein n=1 Tax=Daldinia decipiens TaxID=326647 RepID=UPI0020C4B969|nr:uncharacterized protein F4813DRAFT_375897 [Daldinia decipiens]KAI1653126.1 hypothetical protein F4813DRAFT_375897 [Daldinia decipiens]
MGIAGFLSRVKSVIKPQDRKRDLQEDENVKLPTVSLEKTESTSRASSQSGSCAPKSNKGLRKPSVSSGQSSNRLSAKQSVSSEPTDYLYFGEGVSSAEVSQSLSSQSQSQSKSPSIRPDQSSTTTTGAHNNPAAGSGKDNSGFLKTGMDTQTTQMGYSNLTNGGSLQYDYAGTQAPGVAGVN